MARTIAAKDVNKVPMAVGDAMRCVLACVRTWVGVPDVPLADSLSTSFCCDVLDIADAGRIAPLVVEVLRSQARDLPADVSALLQQRVVSAERDAFLWTAELRGVLQALAADAVAVVPLKGPARAQRMLGRSALRPCRDLDLLVRAEQFPAATVALERIGFSRGGRRGGYEQPFVRRGIKVELHFDLDDPAEFDFDIAGIWQRAQPDEFAGVPIRNLAPTDEFHYLCVHGLRHRYESLGHVLDVELSRRRLAAEGLDPQDAIPESLRPAVSLGLAMASLLTESAVISARRERVEAVAERLWRDLLEGRAPQSGWWAERRLHRQLEEGAARRMQRTAKQLRLLATRTVDADQAFAETLGLHHPLAVRLLRPVRLLLRAVRR